MGSSGGPLGRHHVDDGRRVPPRVLIQEIHHLLLIELLLLHVAPNVSGVGIDDVHDLIVDVGVLMHILGVVFHHGLVDEIVNNTL